MHVATINEREDMNLNESKEGYMVWREKREGGNVNIL